MRQRRDVQAGWAGPQGSALGCAKRLWKMAFDCPKPGLASEQRVRRDCHVAGPTCRARSLKTSTSAGRTRVVRTGGDESWMMNWRRLRDQEAPCRLKAATTPVQGFAFHTCRQVQSALSEMCTICTLTSAASWSARSRNRLWHLTPAGRHSQRDVRCVQPALGR